jgi:hypothetical protein
LASLKTTIKPKSDNKNYDDVYDDKIERELQNETYETYDYVDANDDPVENILDAVDQEKLSRYMEKHNVTRAELLQKMKEKKAFDEKKTRHQI